MGCCCKKSVIFSEAVQNFWIRKSDRSDGHPLPSLTSGLLTGVKIACDAVMYPINRRLNIFQIIMEFRLMEFGYNRASPHTDRWFGHVAFQFSDCTPYGWKPASCSDSNSERSVAAYLWRNCATEHLHGCPGNLLSFVKLENFALHIASRLFWIVKILFAFLSGSSNLEFPSTINTLSVYDNTDFASS